MFIALSFEFFQLSARKTAAGKESTVALPSIIIHPLLGRGNLALATVGLLKVFTRIVKG